MNIMNEYIETKVKGKNATKVDGSVYEHLGLSATILQGCIFQQLFNFCQMTWSKYTPPQYPRRPWKLTPVSHIYICLIYWCIVSYCVYYCQKDPIEATIIYDSLLRYQIRVRHDRLKCKQMFLEKKFLEFCPEIDWIIQITSSPGNLTFLWSSGSGPGKQTVQSNVVNRIWPGCLRWWSRGSQTWHWLEAAEDINIRPWL